MNLLTQGSNSLIKRLPIHRPRDAMIKKLLMLNGGVFAYYTLSTGPSKLRFEKGYNAGPNSGIFSLLYFHFAHTNILQLLFTSGVFYTIGNYHIATYGCQHFIRLFAASALGGSFLTYVGLRTGATTER